MDVFRMWMGETLSFNQPKFCSTAIWNSNGITIANQSIVGRYPHAIFVNTNNTIYVASQQHHAIMIWQEESINRTKIVHGNFTEPYSLFVSSNGDIYIDDGKKNGRVQKWIEETNNFITVMNVSSECGGLFVDINDILYCSMSEQHQVMKRSLNDLVMGSNRVAAGTGSLGSDSNQLAGPLGIFVDVNLDLYVADCINGRVQLFQSGESNGSTVAGYTSLNPTITLEFPSGVILDVEKYLFIVDHYNNRIVGSDLNGFRCLVGCYGRGLQSNQLDKPFSFSFDRSGNIFVIDSLNHRIQKFKYLKRYCGKTSSVPQNIYSSSLTNSNQIYYRDCDKQNFYYESIQVKVIESGSYSFRGSGDIDPYGFIYKNKFNPLDPSENLLDQDYDGGADIQFKLNIHLNSDMAYILVVTTYESKETGEFSVVMLGKNKVIPERLSSKQSSCVIGDRCNFYIKGIGLTLDDILHDELRPNTVLNNQSFAIKLSAGLTIIMFVAGLVNSILSFITFQSKGAQQVGCGMYLLASSVTSLLTMSMFMIKFWFVVLTHINLSTSLSVLRGGCVSIGPILKLFLYLDGWLNSCVAVERAVLIYKG
ncbi:unnamed protein product, partial [Adineta steineri]